MQVVKQPEHGKALTAEERKWNKTQTNHQGTKDQL